MPATNSPVHREKLSQYAPLALCYAANESRKEVLRGSWREGETKALYWNLSCPFEWSKYSCIHQERNGYALKAQRLEFVPNDCALPIVNKFNVYKVFKSEKKRRRFILNGDSLMRQIFVAFACLLTPYINNAKIPWRQCPEKWPCQNAVNCIDCGQHSGFETGAEFHLSIGSSMQYNKHFNGHTQQLKYILPDTDIYIVETGVHGNDPYEMALERINDFVRPLLDRKVPVVWLITPQDAFRTENGFYDSDYLRYNNTSSCAKIRSNTRSQAEWRALRKDPSILDRLQGVIDLQGLNEQGHTKIGSATNTFADCQHYCMPGIPDILAKYIFALLLQITSFHSPSFMNEKVSSYPLLSLFQVPEISQKRSSVVTQKKLVDKKPLLPIAVPTPALPKKERKVMRTVQSPKQVKVQVKRRRKGRKFTKPSSSSHAAKKTKAVEGKKKLASSSSTEIRQQHHSAIQV